MSAPEAPLTERTVEELAGRWPELDEHFPPAGQCMLCGFDDKRHRLWDALIGFHEAGDPTEVIARMYDMPVEAVEAVIRLQPYRSIHD